jgi:alpha-ketoglutarate-dependent taurine dioxygenase
MHVRPLFPSSDSHPVMINPDSPSNGSVAALREYAAANRAEIDGLLLKHGGILFRGFDLSGPDDFRSCVESLGATPYGYVGGNTPRTRVAVDIFTSTEYPASEVIGLHHEMSYLPNWPRRLFFYSLVPAQQGGQTSIASSRDIMRTLSSDVVRRFRDKQVTYIRHFHPSLPVGKSWQATYQTDKREDVEAIAAEQGSTCEWLPGDVLRVTTRRVPLIAHPVTGEEVWFNQAEQWHPSALDPAMRAMLEELVGKTRLPHDCEYGDGQPIEDELLAEVRRVLVGQKLLFDWQRHDLLMIDNVFMMHGREAFTGERKTLAYLSAT